MSNKTIWNNDHPVHAPVGGRRVWIAHETVHDWPGKKVFVSVGYFCPGYACWKFDNGTRVSETGQHVLGWTEMHIPEFNEVKP